MYKLTAGKQPTESCILNAINRNKQERFMSVETLEPDELTENCIKQIDEVISLSEAKVFRT